MSVEEYLDLDRNSIDTRYEFIDGHAYMMSGGTLNHSAISVNILSLLQGLLRGSSCRVYNSDARVHISKTRYFYPDASVSCDERDLGSGDMLQFPRLIVEVLSPGTEEYDRADKFIFYRACPTLQEYVLVDTSSPFVEVFQRESEHIWMLDLFSSGDTVELVSLGVRFPVDALYENIVFPEDTLDNPSM